MSADPLAVRPLAAAHLRDALTAAQRGHLPEALGALMSIDAESWRGIEHRLAVLGSTLPNLLDTATTERTENQ
ncbi:hypothetical protein [Streptacidiphilus monticola]|uniref:Uncharacterized protein n=1 Tax=Streptacidiphilus monticola TaxID=2161674 RepID=A0ABW1GBT0_9ACTN